MKQMMVKIVIAWLVLSAQAGGADLTDADSDGLPDVWEGYFGLSTNNATGMDGAFGDPDADGLSNYVEYMAGYWDIGGNVYSNSALAVPGLSPTNAYSVTAGVLDSYIRPAGTNVCLRFIFTDGDYCDDLFELAIPLGSVDLYDDHRDTPNGNMWRYFRSVQDPSVKSVNLNVQYYGFNARGFSGNLQVWLYKEPTMAGTPLYKESFAIDGNWGSGKTIVITNRAALAQINGDVYVTAFIDIDGNGVWNTGEPLGVGCEYPGQIASGESKINVSLTDMDIRGMRYEIPDGNQGYDRVVIKRETVDGNANYKLTVKDYNVYAGRHWIQESDWLGDGYVGIDWGLSGVPTTMSRYRLGYSIYMGDRFGVSDIPVYTFTNLYEATRPVTVQVWPSSGSVIKSRTVTFRWTSAPSAPYYNIRILDAAGNESGDILWERSAAEAKATRLEGVYLNGEYYYTPNYTFADGDYRWDIEALSDKFSTETSALTLTQVPFTVAGMQMTPQKYGAIDVKLFYAGKSASGNFIVAAYASPSFVGVPVSTQRIAYSASIKNMSVGVAARLDLLAVGTYYVVAWKDADSDGIRDRSESWGYYNWLGTPGKVFFAPRAVNVQIEGGSPLVSVVVEDQPGTGRR